MHTSNRIKPFEHLAKKELNENLSKQITNQIFDMLDCQSFKWFQSIQPNSVIPTFEFNEQILKSGGSEVGSRPGRHSNSAPYPHYTRAKYILYPSTRKFATQLIDQRRTMWNIDPIEFIGQNQIMRTPDEDQMSGNFSERQFQRAECTTRCLSLYKVASR